MPYHHPAVMHSLDNPPEKKYIDGIQKKEIKLKLEIEKEREGDDAKKHKKNVEKNVEMCLLKKVKYLL